MTLLFPRNSEFRLRLYLSFTNGAFRVAAVPESISLLHSYLCMWPLSIVSPTILAPLTKSAGFPGAQGTRERAA